jgi:surface protein
MYGMFCGCESLTELDLSGFETSRTTDFALMFGGCTQLKTIYVSELWDISDAVSFDLMFVECANIVGAISYDSTKTNGTYANYQTGYLTYKAHSVK